MRSIEQIKKLQRDTKSRIESSEKFLIELEAELRAATAAVKKRGRLINMEHVNKIERALESFRVKGRCIGFGLIAVDDENPTILLGWYAPEGLFNDLYAHLRACNINLEDVDLSEDMSVNHDLYKEVYETNIYGGPEEWSCN